jgi:hypothetical protein
MKDTRDATGRPMAPTVVRRFRVGVVLTVALVLLGVVWAGMGTVTYRLATAPAPSDVMLTARLDGVLAAQANIDGTTCFWVGDGQYRTALSWPWGYSARGSPLAPAWGWGHADSLSRLAVYDEAGKRIAEVGRRVALGGGLMAEDVKSLRGCSGFPQFWAVGTVINPT